MVRAIVRDKLRFEALRPGQQEARALLDGTDTLAVQPTGSGKSAVYQIAGTMIPGPTVIVSSLIALQRDQREGSKSSKATSVSDRQLPYLIQDARPCDRRWTCETS